MGATGNTFVALFSVIEDTVVHRKIGNGRNIKQAQHAVANFHTQGENVRHLKQAADDDGVNLWGCLKLAPDIMHDVFGDVVKCRDADNVQSSRLRRVWEFVNSTRQKPVTHPHETVRLRKTGPVGAPEFCFNKDWKTILLESPINVPTHASKLPPTPDSRGRFPPGQPKNLLHRAEMFMRIAQASFR